MQNLPVRILAANVTLKGEVWNLFTTEEKQLLDNEMRHAENKRSAPSTRLASILTVEILLRRKGIKL